MPAGRSFHLLRHPHRWGRPRWHNGSACFGKNPFSRWPENGLVKHWKPDQLVRDAGLMPKISPYSSHHSRNLKVNSPEFLRRLRVSSSSPFKFDNRQHPVPRRPDRHVAGVGAHRSHMHGRSDIDSRCRGIDHLQVRVATGRNLRHGISSEREEGCVFRSDPATCSKSIRPPIPILSGH